MHFIPPPHPQWIFFFFRIMIQAVYSSVKNKLIFTFCGWYFWYFKNIIIFKSQNGLMAGPPQACAPENWLSHQGMPDRFGSSQGGNYSWENWGCLGITLHCVQVRIASYIPGNTAKFVSFLPPMRFLSFTIPLFTQITRTKILNLFYLSNLYLIFCRKE